MPRHLGAEGMARGILLGLLTAISERLVLKPSGEHSKFNRDIPRHKWLLPRLSTYLPERESVCCSAVPDQVRGLTARSTALLLIQSKEGLPAGIWSDRNE